ncbi:MAG: glycosyltransferase family 2 protein [Phycisphaerae bacterium]|nr:glycosyltransferase family 2 protein [Phycisphaerae bacterium]
MSVPGGVGVVVIGRNEGERLVTCLRSVDRWRASAARRGDVVGPIVYVDSGSADASVEVARGFGAEVVSLDPTRPFTAARARNEGFDRLLRVAPGVGRVQFIDGDCEMSEGWFDRAVQELDARPRVAVVYGRVRERFPERSVYNTLCDLSWDMPVGEVRSCGGIFMVRCPSFREVGGFNPALIAGEEPDLSLRLRRHGGLIWRVDAEMCLHDSAMLRFGQWWRRSVRTGHSYAQGHHMHGAAGERHWAFEVRSMLIWALLVPLLAAVPMYWTRGLSLGVLALYPLQWWRIRAGQRRRGRTSREANIFATFILLEKFANLAGAATFHFNRLRGRETTIIEHKLPAPGAAAGTHT